jgi:hypothetical protein
MRLLLACVLALAVTPLFGADKLSQAVLDLVNEERADADRRELEIYGELLTGPRLPLEYDPMLAYSSQWWCDGLKGTGLLVHGWFVNSQGYLILDPSNPKILNKRVRFPQTDGWTDWNDRLRYLEVYPLRSSENGVLASSLTADEMFFLWKNRGWQYDPRQVNPAHHYFNLIRPAWTHAGVGKGASGTTGRSYGFMGFAQFALPSDPLTEAVEDEYDRHGPPPVLRVR